MQGIPYKTPFARCIRYLTLIVLICATALTASAQYRTSIQGTVTDTSGAVIPGATLTLTNTATNEKQVRTSDAGGVYNFNALPPATFTLVVTKDQFQVKELLNLQLIPEQANSINVQMEPGVATQTVTVDASTQSEGWDYLRGKGNSNPSAPRFAG